MRIRRGCGAHPVGGGVVLGGMCVSLPVQPSAPGTTPPAKPSFDVVITNNDQESAEIRGSGRRACDAA
jgi:hypothetical protein